MDIYGMLKWFIAMCIAFVLFLFINRVEGFNGFQNVEHSKQQEQVSKLLRQIARWSAAAQQDTNPYIQNLHATYAVGYLLALREIYSDAFISRVSGINVEHLNNKVTKIMDTAIQNLVKVCPQGRIKDDFLFQLANSSV